MKRRDFLKLSGAASAGFLAGQKGIAASKSQPRNFYVALTGSDDKPGTEEEPFLTLHRAQQAVRNFRRGNPALPVTVLVRRGTHYLGKTLVFSPEDSGTTSAPVTYAAYPGEEVTLSGGRKLTCRWQIRNEHKVACVLGATNSGPFSFTQLFINGKRQVRARFPNYDPAVPGKSGYVSAVRAIPPGTSSPDPAVQQWIEKTVKNPHRVLGIEFDPATFSGGLWSKPEEAVIHIFQNDGFGMLEWKLLSIDYDRNFIWFGEGGDQLGPNWNPNVPVIGKNSRYFVDNVFAEWSDLGEWYLDTAGGALYYRPDGTFDITAALIEVPVLDQIVRVEGDGNRFVENVSIEGFRLAHTASTYMKSYEAPQGSKWAFHRGGAIFLEGTRNCAIRDCWFDAVGGNAVFWSGPNAGGSVSGSKFTEAGNNAICFAGVAKNGAGGSNEFPSDCSATDNLIHDCGAFGKQIAGVLIASAERITAAHNHIYNMPCSAIAVSDGVGGGHRIQGNEIHDVNRETAHHGAINGWGSKGTSPTTSITIDGNLVRGTSGPALLFTDHAAGYDVYDNIADGAAIHIGAGAARNLHNNIIYNSASPIVFEGRRAQGSSEDRFHHNIGVIPSGETIVVSSATPEAPQLGQIDNNCYFHQDAEFVAFVRGPRQWQGPQDHPRRESLAEWRKLGFDEHSVFADPMIADPASLDFRVLDGSPALKLGFKNFPMRQWGLTGKSRSKWKA